MDEPQHVVTDNYSNSFKQNGEKRVDGKLIPLFKNNPIKRMLHNVGNTGITRDNTFKVL